MINLFSNRTSPRAIQEERKSRKLSAIGLIFGNASYRFPRCFIVYAAGTPSRRAYYAR